jgi:hypothetical protein
MPDDWLAKACKNPHFCAETVESQLDHLLPRWDPRLPSLPVPGEEDPIEDLDESKVLFTPPNQIQTLTEGFHIFTLHNGLANDVLGAMGPHPQATATQ